MRSLSRSGGRSKGQPAPPLASGPTELERLLQRAAAPELRQRLRDLDRAWWQAMPAAERARALSDDYDHWRLFVRSREGDAAAALAFEAHWRSAVRAFVGRGFTREQVDEFAAAFFARVYEKASGFDFRSPFVVYLRTVLLNLSRDEIRRLQRQRARSVSLEEDAGGGARHADGRPNPEAVALAGERRDLVRAALDVIDPASRYLLRELVAEGRAGREVAAELRITTATLYQRLHRAKKKLREALLALDAAVVVSGS